jgi:serpin B
MKTTFLLKLISITTLTSLLLGACRTPGGAPTPDQMIHSNRQRITSADVPSDDLQELVRGDNAFALELYQALHGQTGNLFYSPFSISLALAMTYAGARGQTESQLSSALHFTLPQARLHPSFNALDLALEKKTDPSSKDGQPLQLDIANAVWAQQDYPFLPEYLDLVATNYGAGINLADFVNHAPTVRQEINNWVSDKTKGKIEDLIPQGVLDALTRMVLVNAIYFKADWQTPFDPNSTHDAPFHLLDGSDVQASMMSEGFNNLPYARGNGYQAVELPYNGGTAAMDVILPDEDKFEAFEAGLDTNKLDEVLNHMKPAAVDLSLPKFKFTSEFSLSDQLAALGMPDAFNPDRADFSGMDGRDDLYISAVIHKAFVAVDEKGTEAAAATAVIMRLESALMSNVSLTVDRPFLFIIRDLPSGQILFIGHVLNPQE